MCPPFLLLLVPSCKKFARWNPLRSGHVPFVMSPKAGRMWQEVTRSGKSSVDQLHQIFYGDQSFSLELWLCNAASLGSRVKLCRRYGSCSVTHSGLPMCDMCNEYQVLKASANFLVVDVFLSAAVFCFLVSALGITAGAHRLWSHRSYKASLPLRIFLGVANSMAFQVTDAHLALIAVLVASAKYRAASVSSSSTE